MSDVAKCQRCGREMWTDGTPGNCYRCEFPERAAAFDRLTAPIAPALPIIEEAIRQRRAAEEQKLYDEGRDVAPDDIDLREVVRKTLEVLASKGRRPSRDLEVCFTCGGFLLSDGWCLTCEMSR